MIRKSNSAGFSLPHFKQALQSFVGILGVRRYADPAIRQLEPQRPIFVSVGACHLDRDQTKVGTCVDISINAVAWSMLGVGYEQRLKRLQIVVYGP
jgi:hypothetical protein